METNKSDSAQSSRSGRVRNVPNFAKLASGEKQHTGTSPFSVSKGYPGILRPSFDLHSTTIGAAAEVLATLAVQSSSAANADDPTAADIDNCCDEEGINNSTDLPDWVHEKVIVPSLVIEHRNLGSLSASPFVSACLLLS
jgi:hypothetical protein